MCKLVGAVLFIQLTSAAAACTIGQRCFLVDGARTCAADCKAACTPRGECWYEDPACNPSHINGTDGCKKDDMVLRCLKGMVPSKDRTSCVPAHAAVTKCVIGQKCVMMDGARTCAAGCEAACTPRGECWYKDASCNPGAITGADGCTSGDLVLRCAKGMVPANDLKSCVPAPPPITKCVIGTKCVMVDGARTCAAGCEAACTPRGECWYKDPACNPGAVVGADGCMSEGSVLQCREGMVPATDLKSCVPAPVSAPKCFIGQKCVLIDGARTCAPGCEAACTPSGKCWYKDAACNPGAVPGADGCKADDMVLRCKDGMVPSKDLRSCVPSLCKIGQKCALVDGARTCANSCKAACTPRGECWYDSAACNPFSIDGTDGCKGDDSVLRCKRGFVPSKDMASCVPSKILSFNEAVMV